MTSDNLTVSKTAGLRRVRIISVYGLTESAVAERLIEIKARFPRFELDLRTKFPEVRLSLYAGEPDKDHSKDLAAVVQWVCGRLGNHVCSDTGRSMEQVVGGLLHAKKATLALAESCTGGLIANRLTDVPGSSDYFLFSAVTYANQAKIKLLDVKPETLAKHGAVSEQTACEMARGAKNVVGATYGLATSGIAGPGGGAADKPVGTVCIGLATPFSVIGYRFNFASPNRRRNKHIFAVTALDLLRQELLRAE